MVSAIAAIVTVKLLFVEQQVLPTAEFIEIYVKQRHPWNYSVPDFRNLKGNWFVFFILMNGLFAIPFIYGLIRKRRKLWILSILVWISYSGAVTIQYIFIEVIPSKLIGYLGVSRFTTFGYWMLVVIWAILLSDFVKKNKGFVFPSISLKNFGIIIISLIFVGIVFIDNPIERFYTNRKEYYDFLRSTPEDAVFMTYSSRLYTDMRLIGRRGVFIGMEFPFAEKYIAEYGERYSLMFGSRGDGIEETDYYRSLNPNDFIEISKKYQLNYILIESRFNSAFENKEPVWKNQRHSLYRLENQRF